MRPLRLELEGFASFRNHVCIDFQDADLFVLFGPTGAGKSSIIDAITFALYGTVARYDDQRMVWPIISQGANEAKVRLDFRASGQEWTAVRVVRRVGTGATTREARLERAGAVIAGNADELSEHIARIVGLSFDHFTRCVVLPQGDFAQFLHAKPADRQNLLVRLLGLDVYRRIAQAANQRAAERAGTAAHLSQQLQGLAGATEDALQSVRERAAALEALLQRLEAERRELALHVAQHEKAAQEERAAQARVALLHELVIPPGTLELAARISAAQAELAARDRALQAATDAREAAEQLRAALPERSRLLAALQKHQQHERLGGQLGVANEAVARASAVQKAAQEEATAGEDTYAAALRSLEEQRAHHAAYHLAGHLTVGQDCPVCLQRVRRLPEHAVPVELRGSEEACRAEEAACASARQVLTRAEQDLIRRSTEADGLRAQLEALTTELAELPAAAEAQAQLERVDDAERNLHTAREAETAARAALRTTQTAADRLHDELTRARERFDQARDRIAAQGLAPPPAQRQDLQEDWARLINWSRARAPEEEQAAAAARQQAAAAAAWVQQTIAAQRQACAELGVDAGTGDPYPACANAAAHARAQAARIEQDLETAARLRRELAVTDKEVRTAELLGRLLDARNFERWLMRRALNALVAGATQRLLQLSAGAYSMALDERNEFLVVDHRNADTKRPARTLSGGETFLASLALALSLADHVAQMAAGGAAPLDALFLDEGFGTLDAETLDVVASAMEELGARGRMIGIVTHVRELAERMPVRFDVRKTAGISCVERAP
jgi:exonuclease SbcC